MTLGDNKRLVRRFVEEFWRKGNLAAEDELMAPDAIIHQPEVSGVVDLKEFNTMMRTAFPDWHSTPEELIADVDRVIERWTGLGTHRGGFRGISPTGNQVAAPGVVFYRLQNGKIVEFRGSFDFLNMMK